MLCCWSCWVVFLVAAIAERVLMTCIGGFSCGHYWSRYCCSALCTFLPLWRRVVFNFGTSRLIAGRELQGPKQFWLHYFPHPWFHIQPTRRQYLSTPGPVCHVPRSQVPRKRFSQWLCRHDQQEATFWRPSAIPLWCPQECWTEGPCNCQHIARDGCHHGIQKNMVGNLKHPILENHIFILRLPCLIIFGFKGTFFERTTSTPITIITSYQIMGTATQKTVVLINCDHTIVPLHWHHVPDVLIAWLDVVFYSLHFWTILHGPWVKLAK